MNGQFDTGMIRSKGWRQGSVCMSLVPAGYDIPGTLAILLSHDCDIVQPDIKKEPNVEILLAVPIAEPDGNCTRGKNPRCYHFTLRDTIHRVDLAYQIQAIDRISLPRRLLVEYEPYSLQLSDKEVRAIVYWFTQRYKRPAFPDNFNRRFSNKTKQVMERAIKESGDIISGIYITCPEEELPDGKPYIVRFHVVMSVEDFNDVEKVDKCEEIADMIYNSMKTHSSGIHIVNPKNIRVCISEEKISLHDLRLLKRFTSFDHFSFDVGVEP